MEITIVNEYYPPYVTGGTELFLQSLAEFLVSKGNKVKVICTLQEGLKEHDKQGSIEIHRIKSSPIKIGYRYQIPGLTFYWNHFNQTVKSKVKRVAENSDIVYINNSRHLSLAPFQAARELDAKVVFDVHDYWPICFKKDLFKEGKVCNYRSAWECTYCLSSEKVSSVISPILFPFLYIDYKLREKNIAFDKAICHSNWMDSILPFDAEVIPYPIREKAKDVKAKKFDQPVGLLFVGRIQRQKGVHLFPEIARGLMRKGINFKFGFMGSGEIEDELKKEMADVPATFYGWVSDFEKKAEIFSNYHLLLAPSLWAEPFGMVAIEAMSFATPSIVSNRGGLKEIVEKNKSGFAVQPSPQQIVDSIYSITKRTYKKLSANCLKNIKDYDKEKIMKQYLKIFERNL